MRGQPVTTMDSRTTLDRVRALFTKADEQNYEPLSDASTIDDDVHRPVVFAPDPENGEVEQDKTDEGQPFSWFEYCIFLLLGIAMLWAWYVTPSSRKGWKSDSCKGICS
jgi:equilibrative nucleoside transporter 1/2/3